jgi:hypothetical protein
LNGNKTTRSETGLNVLWRERYFSCRAEEGSKMLLADCIHTSSLESINLVAIGCFQRGKYCNITRLELVRGMRGETTEDNIVFETKL